LENAKLKYSEISTFEIVKLRRRENIMFYSSEGKLHRTKNPTINCTNDKLDVTIRFH